MEDEKSLNNFSGTFDKINFKMEFGNISLSIKENVEIYGDYIMTVIEQLENNVTVTYEYIVEEKIETPAFNLILDILDNHERFNIFYLYVLNYFTLYQKQKLC